ncbi:MAG TPA: hypothetical protein VK897_22905 [Anaerolineales bacterium]|nr:hypothetical protein [Anaerolineales bacterium]
MNENRREPIEGEIIDTNDESVENERRVRAEERMEKERMEYEERTGTRAEPQTAEPRAAAVTEQGELMPLFEDNEAKQFRTQWLNIQSKFVDDPRESVKQADELVASVLKSVTMGFSDRRVALEQQWNSGEDISTEDLRVALKRYRSFFDRLLTLES